MPTTCCVETFYSQSTKQHSTIRLMTSQKNHTRTYSKGLALPNLLELPNLAEPLSSSEPLQLALPSLLELPNLAEPLSSPEPVQLVLPNQRLQRSTLLTTFYVEAFYSQSTKQHSTKRLMTSQESHTRTYSAGLALPNLLRRLVGLHSPPVSPLVKEAEPMVSILSPGRPLLEVLVPSTKQKQHTRLSDEWWWSNLSTAMPHLLLITKNLFRKMFSFQDTFLSFFSLVFLCSTVRNLILSKDTIWRNNLKSFKTAAIKAADCNTIVSRRRCDVIYVYTNADSRLVWMGLTSISTTRL